MSLFFFFFTAVEHQLLPEGWHTIRHFSVWVRLLPDFQKQYWGSDLSILSAIASALKKVIFSFRSTNNQCISLTYCKKDCTNLSVYLEWFFFFFHFLLCVRNLICDTETSCFLQTTVEKCHFVFRSQLSGENSCPAWHFLLCGTQWVSSDSCFFVL